MTKHANITLITLAQPQGITRRFFSSVQVNSVSRNFKLDPAFAYPMPETTHSFQDLRFRRRIRGKEVVNSKSKLDKDFLIDNQDFKISLEFPCDSYSVTADQFANTADPHQTYIIDLQSYLSPLQITSKTIEIFIENIRKNNPLISFVLIINQNIYNDFLEEIHTLSKKLSFQCIYNEGNFDYTPAIKVAAVNNLRPVDTIQKLYQDKKGGEEAIKNLPYNVTLADIVNNDKNLESDSPYYQTLVALNLITLTGLHKPALTEQLINEQIYLDFLQTLEEKFTHIQKSARSAYEQAH